MVDCLFDGAAAYTGGTIASAVSALAAVSAPTGLGRRQARFVQEGCMENDKAKLARLVAEYERLRRLLHELDVQANTVDGRLVEIERELPDRYTFPGDLPHDRL